MFSVWQVWWPRTNCWNIGKNDKLVLNSQKTKNSKVPIGLCPISGGSQKCKIQEWIQQKTQMPKGTFSFQMLYLLQRTSSNFSDCTSNSTKYCCWILHTNHFPSSLGSSFLCGQYQKLDISSSNVAPTLCACEVPLYPIAVQQNRHPNFIQMMSRVFGNEGPKNGSKEDNNKKRWRTYLQIPQIHKQPKTIYVNCEDALFHSKTHICLILLTSSQQLLFCLLVDSFQHWGMPSSLTDQK